MKIHWFATLPPRQSHLNAQEAFNFLFPVDTMIFFRILVLRNTHAPWSFNWNRWQVISRGEMIAFWDSFLIDSLMIQRPHEEAILLPLSAVWRVADLIMKKLHRLLLRILTSLNRGDGILMGKRSLYADVMLHDKGHFQAWRKMRDETKQSTFPSFIDIIERYQSLRGHLHVEQWNDLLLRLLFNWSLNRAPLGRTKLRPGDPVSVEKWWVQVHCV